MKILLLIDVYKDGGAEKVYDLCTSYFSEKKFDVKRFRLYKNDNRQNGPIAIIEKQNSSSLFGKILDQKKAIKKIKHIVINESIEQVISFLDRSNITVINACAGLKNKPSVTVTVHNPPTLQYLKLNMIIRFFVHKSIAKKYNKNWVKVIAVSETIKKSLHSIGVKNVEIVYNPFVINEKKINEYKDIPNKDFFLAIGRLENQKAHWKILKAYYLYLKNEYSEKSDLYLLGEGSLKEKLLTLANSLGISNKVHFEGYIMNPFPYYKNCKCIIFSSLFEGFPVTLVEAFSQEKSYIGSDDSIPIEYRNFLAAKGIKCTYTTEQFSEDYSTTINSDEKRLSELMLKLEKDRAYKDKCSKLGYEWFKKNCSTINFEKYIYTDKL